MRFLFTLIVAALAANSGSAAYAGQLPAAPAAPPAAQAAPAAPAEQPLTLPANVCGLEVPAPAAAPPAGTPPVMYINLLCFEKQGGVPVIEGETYLYYIELKNHVSVPSANKWVPYTDEIEQVILADFRRLWAT